MRTIRSITNLVLKDKGLIIILLVLSSLIALDPFLRQGIFTAHDIEANIARFGAFYSSFMEGNIIPRWAKDLANGYGGPILMLSYSLPYYLALPLHLFGFSLIDSIKILNWLTLVSSALLMYFFLRFYFRSFPSFLGSLLYVFAPYRIANIYARGSVSENTAFLFVPLAALLLVKFWARPTIMKIVLLAFSFSFIILSHPFFGIIMTPFFLGLILYLFLGSKSWIKLGGLAFSLVLALGLTAYFTLPLLIETKYLHYDINPFVNTYKTEGLTLLQLILPTWSFLDKAGKLEYQTWQLGILNLSIFLVSFPFLFMKRLPQKAILGLGIFLFILSGFISLKITLPLYEIIKPLRQIQFPWRFLALNVISLPLLAAPIFSLAEEKLKKFFYFCGFWIIVILLVSSLPFARGHNYQVKTDHYYLYEIVNNTEGVATQPRWSALPGSYPRKTVQLQVIEGKGTIEELSSSSVSHILKINAQTPLRLVDNTFYFPGWQVTVDKQKVPIEFQNESFRGLITFNIPEGLHNVEVKFGETKLRQAADLISLGSLFLVFTFILISKLKPGRLPRGL